MSFEIMAIPPFNRQLKRLAKKYPSIGKDLKELGESLKENLVQGIALGQDYYKLRLSISSKGKGKSGGARIITCVRIVNETVFLLTIYDKSEQENLSDKELSELLEFLTDEE